MIVVCLVSSIVVVVSLLLFVLLRNERLSRVQCLLRRFVERQFERKQSEGQIIEIKLNKKCKLSSTSIKEKSETR